MIDVHTSTSLSCARKSSITFFELAFLHLSVRDREARLRHQLADPLGHPCDRGDAVVDEEHLPAARELALDRLLDHPLFVARDVRTDREPIHWRRLDQAQVAHAGKRELERARNRRRGQREHVHLAP
jgi:hypothetical protein